METIDLGLKGEEERINNNSVRDEVLKLQINGKIQAKMRNYKDTRRQKRIEEIETSIGETVVKSDNGEDDHDDEDDNNLLVDSSEYLSDKQSDDPVVGEKRSRELLVDTELDEKKTEVHNGNGEGDDGQVEVMSKYARRIMNRPVSAVNGIYTMALARPNTTMKGHTAFLTFATAPLY